MLAKACDKFLPQNKKIQNRKTMVTTWHRALEHLSQTLQKNYHQHIENDINSKKVFPEKPITENPKKKSIRNHIVRTDIKDADEQK